MNDKRLTKLTEMHERGTIKRGHIDEMLAELRRQEGEIERERMRLAACDVVACADTPETALKARQMHEDYKSPALESVARRVDECIKLRAVNAQLLEALQILLERASRNSIDPFALQQAVQAITKATGETK
jgi:hypothetical protein